MGKEKQVEVKELYSVSGAKEIVSIKVIRETAQRYYVLEPHRYIGGGTGRYVANFPTWIPTFIQKDDPAWFCSRDEAIDWGIGELSNLVRNVKQELLEREAELAAFDKRYRGEDG